MHIRSNGVYTSKAHQLKGYLFEAQSCNINDISLIVNKDFNVYEEHGMFCRYLHKNNTELTNSEQFIEWLEKEELVYKSTKKTKNRDTLSRYKTYPVCPKYRLVEEAHEMILSSIPIRSKEYYLSLSNQDTFNFAVYLENHIGFKLKNDHMFDQIKTLLEEVQKFVRELEDQVLLKKGELR